MSSIVCIDIGDPAPVAVEWPLATAAAFGAVSGRANDSLGMLKTVGGGAVVAAAADGDVAAPGGANGCVGRLWDR